MTQYQLFSLAILAAAILATVGSIHLFKIDRRWHSLLLLLSSILITIGCALLLSIHSASYTSQLNNSSTRLAAILFIFPPIPFLLIGLFRFALLWFQAHRRINQLKNVLP
ncbi:MAG: hypothetical protein AAGC74_13740 [Verrucomicrobiota bacterium]